MVLHVVSPACCAVPVSATEEARAPFSRGYILAGDGCADEAGGLVR